MSITLPRVAPCRVHGHVWPDQSISDAVTEAVCSRCGTMSEARQVPVQYVPRHVREHVPAKYVSPLRLTWLHAPARE